MTTEEIKKTLEDNARAMQFLPGLIFEASVAANHRSEIAEMEISLKDILIDLEGYAKVETDGDGNLKYTNQNQRERRAREMAETHDDYQAIKSRLDTMKDDQFNAGITLDKLRNELSARKAAIHAFAALLDSENQALAATTKSKSTVVEVRHV